MKQDNPFIEGKHPVPQPIDQKVVERREKSHRFLRTFLPLLFFTLLVGTSVVGYILYNRLYAPGVSLSSHQESTYSLLIPNRFTKTTQNGVDIYTDTSLDVAKTSEIRVQKLYTLIGDRASYVRTLSGTVSEKAIQDYGLTLEQNQTLSNLETTSDVTVVGKEHWQFSARVQESGRVIAYITVRLQATESNLYAISVLTRLSGARLEDKAPDITSSFSEL